MISVEAAQAELFKLARPLETETIPLRAAQQRIMIASAKAARTQPPFDASAMDGYALKRHELEKDALFKVVGEAAAGHGWQGTVGPGQTVRIFTGAPVPNGADTIAIQEDVTRSGDLITITGDPGDTTHIRPAGGDFLEGELLEAPRRLSASDIALLASMNVAAVTVTRKPIVALISTGDELVMPGETPGTDQIIASNTFGLEAMLTQAGAEVRVLPIARDTEASLMQGFALTHGTDLVVTIGGASVGDHDLVAPVAEKLGMERSFYKIAMRPGKPLMAGRIKKAAMVGLPGNPVSAMVCGHIFLRPMLDAMLGLGARAPEPMLASLSAPLSQNGPRQHYMRARLDHGEISAFDRQDSSLLRVLSKANALLIRPPHDGAREIGETVQYLPL